VSVGIFFNKVFAKLGSDMRKPDATTAITPENFRETAWPLPVSDLLYVGPATTRKLRQYGITTIRTLQTGNTIRFYDNRKPALPTGAAQQSSLPQDNPYTGIVPPAGKSVFDTKQSHLRSVPHHNT